MSKITGVTQEQTRKRLSQARQALRREMQVVKELVFLKTHTHVRLSPRQAQTIDEAIRKASEVVAIYAEDYNRAATELIASNPK